MIPTRLAARTRTLNLHCLSLERNGFDSWRGAPRPHRCAATPPYPAANSTAQVPVLRRGRRSTHLPSSPHRASRLSALSLLPSITYPPALALTAPFSLHRLPARCASLFRAHAAACLCLWVQTTSSALPYLLITPSAMCAWRLARVDRVDERYARTASSMAALATTLVPTFYRTRCRLPPGVTTM